MFLVWTIHENKLFYPTKIRSDSYLNHEGSEKDDDEAKKNCKLKTEKYHF